MRSTIVFAIAFASACGDATKAGASGDTQRTATHAAFAAVVSDAQHDACELVVAAYDAAHGTEYAGGFVAWRPDWDGISEPVPAPLFWHQRIQARHAIVDQFPAALAGCDQLGGRAYQAIVTPVENALPANTTDSVYAAGAYDAGLPMRDSFAAAAAWYLDLGLPLPPRESLP